MNEPSGILEMAKKHASSKRNTPEETPKSKGTMLTLRGSDEWRAWIDELRDFDRSGSVADLIDRALAVYAREIRFTKNPPKR